MYNDIACVPQTFDHMAFRAEKINDLEVLNFDPLAILTYFFFWRGGWVGFLYFQSY